MASLIDLLDLKGSAWTRAHDSVLDLRLSRVAIPPSDFVWNQKDYVHRSEHPTNVEIRSDFLGKRRDYCPEAFCGSSSRDLILEFLYLRENVREGHLKAPQ